MANINRFAGFTSPSRLARDPFLSPEEKLGALSTWRGQVRRLGQETDSDASERLMCEINRALSRLSDAS